LARAGPRPTSPWAPLLCHLSDTGTGRTGASRPGPPPLADRAAPLPGEALSSLAALLAGLVEQQPAQPLRVVGGHRHRVSRRELGVAEVAAAGRVPASRVAAPHLPADRKSTRLNSSHVKISYAVFCLKKK